MSWAKTDAKCELNRLAISRRFSAKDLNGIRLPGSAIRTPPPPLSDRSLLNIVKPESNISDLLILCFNHVSLTHITSCRVFGVHQALEAKEVTHGLPVCCAVFVITF